MLMLSARSALAEPCTLYKARNITIAKANIERYDWAKSLLKGYQSSASFVMQQDREFFRQIVPDLTPGSVYGQVCPPPAGTPTVETVVAAHAAAATE